MVKWWMEKPMRLVQTNLREIDASLDADKFVQSLKDFSADVVLFNVGGIVANYPTELDCHYRNPYLKDDLVGKVISRVKQEGIRFIARFDFSKINETIGNNNSEWLYKSSKGEHIYYNGQVHTCINSTYQQEHALKILGEVIDRYPVDGVFFNMIGYVTYDYSGNDHGICQCDSCRKRFYERYALPLPLKEDENDLVFRKYESFRRETSSELFHKITDFIKSKNDDIAICTYTHEGVDIYRKESNTGMNRPLPEWNYSASENVKTVLGSWENMAVSNSAVHFVDFPYRHSAVSPNLTAIRLAQDIANGGWLDYYVIGTLDNQDDRLCFDKVKKLFAFHKKNEKYYSNVESNAGVCLIVPDSSSFYGSMKEFRGLFRILAENHILFEVIHDSIFDKPGALEKLNKYNAVVLPDVRCMSESFIEVIDGYAASGGKVLATGFTSTCDRQGNPIGGIRLKSSGISSVNSVIGQSKGTYFRIRETDKSQLYNFTDLDIVYLYGDFMDCNLDDNAQGLLGFIPKSMFGPPEKCYYSEETDVPGLIVNKYGNGKCVFIPWGIGTHYEKLSNHGHSMLVYSSLIDLLKVENKIVMDASPLVELTSLVQKDGNHQLINLINLSGQLGTAFIKPVPIMDIEISVMSNRLPKKIFSLWDEREIEFKCGNDGEIEFILPKLDLLETIVIE